MTRIIDEQLSALLDGELPAEQESLLLRRLEREPESLEKLARFGLIGELVRDPSTQASAMVIRERVARDIAAEKVVNPTAREPSPPSSVRLGLVGAGIAASIALLVMINLTDRPVASRISGGGLAAQSTLPEHTDMMTVDSARLTRYLVSHARYSNTASRQLADSHITMVAATPVAWSNPE